MKSKISQTMVVGIIATAVMTGFIFMAPVMGLPKMNPSALLSGMMGMPLFIGYLLHFMIGIIFAAAYVYVFNPKVHIHSKLAKGALFGFVVLMTIRNLVLRFIPRIRQGSYQ